MRTLAELEPIGRKQWAKRKWDEYQETELAKTIGVSKLVYNEPTNKKMEGVIDKPKWKATVDKKVNYLLGRPPVCEGHQDILDSLDSLLRETAKNIYLAGSAIWIVQGNGVDIDPVPMIMSDTIAVYSDQNKQEVFGYVRKRVEIEADLKAVEDLVNKFQKPEDMSDADVSELKNAKEKLEQSAQKVFSKMYESAQAAGAAQGGPQAGPNPGAGAGPQPNAGSTNNSGNNGDDVVDADFKEV